MRTSTGIIPIAFALHACSSAPAEPAKPLPTQPPAIEPPAQTSASATPVPSVVATASASATATVPPPPERCPAGMAFVPGGSYTWGVKKEKVTVEAFCMDLTETTADQYAAC